MATVYRGHDERLKRNVAIKVIADHLADVPLFVNRFRYEVEVSARLRHPNIVAVLDAGDEPRDYMVLEFVDGPHVGRLLAERRRLTRHDTVRLVASICEALAYAHERMVVHGDVSHRNVLIRRSDGTIKLADFGLSSSAGDTAATCPATIIGTAGYVAPAPRMPPLADIRSDLPSGLVSAVQRATAPQAHARQDSVTDFRNELIAGQDAFLPSSRPQASPGPAVPVGLAMAA